MARKKLIAAALVGLAAILLLAFVLWTANRGITPPLFRASNANAYDTLVHAAKIIEDVNPKPATNELPAYLEVNSAALKTLRKALQQPSEAPPAAYEAATMSTTLNELGSMKSLAIVLQNEGRYAEQQHKWADAARSYQDIILLGQTVESGPIIFALIGISIERIGYEALGKLEPQLTSPARAEIATALKQINAQRLPFTAIEDRERYFRRRNSPTPIHYLIFSRHLRAAMAKFQSKYESNSQAVDALASKLDLPPATVPE